MDPGGCVSRRPPAGCAPGRPPTSTKDLQVHKRTMEGAPSADEAPPEASIRVVNAARRQRDILSVPENELRSILADLAAETEGRPDDERRLQTARAIRSLAGLAAIARADEKTRASPAGTAPLIAGRQLLYDHGVCPLGANVSPGVGLGGGRTPAPEAASMVTVPARKPVWAGAPPQRAAGFSARVWASAAASGDVVQTSAAVVLPAFLGRDPFALPAVRPAFLATPEVVLTVLAEYEAAAAAVPGLADDNRLSPGYYARALVDGARPPLLAGSAPDQRGALIVPLPADDPEALGRLSERLNFIYDFGRGAAALSLRLAAVPSGAESFRVKRRRLAALAPRTPRPAGETAVVFDPVFFPFTAPPPEYRRDLSWLAREAATASRDPIAALPAAPLNVENFVAERAGGEALRRLLAGETREEAAGAYLRGLKRKAQAEAASAATSAAANEAAARARQYLIIAEAKLGSSRYQEVLRRIQGDPRRYSIDNPEDILEAVGQPDDRALLVAEYDKTQRELALEAANSCPHVGLVRRFRQAVGLVESARRFRPVTELFVTPATEAGSFAQARAVPTWVVCKACTFPLLCPHEVVLHEARERKAPYSEIREVLAPFVKTVDFEGGAERGAEYAYYCKVCSAELFTRLPATVGAPDAAEELGRVGGFEPGLRRAVWVAAVRLADPAGARKQGGRPLLRFAQPVDPRRFAEEAARVCHPLASSSWRRRGKKFASLSGRVRRLAAPPAGAGRGPENGPGGEPAPEPAAELLALVYLYAYLFILVLNSARAAGDRLRVGLEGVRDGAAPDLVAKTLLIHLVASQSLLLSKLESVSKEQIGNQFQLAYKDILNTSGSLQLIVQDAKQVFLSVLVQLNPLFSALAMGAAVAPGQDKAKRFKLLVHPASSTPAEAAEAFELVMGASVVQLAVEGPEADEQLAPFVRSALSHRGGVEYPAGPSPDWVYRLPEISLFRRAWGSRDGRAAGYWKKMLAARKGELPALAGAYDRPVWYGGKERRKQKGNGRRSLAEMVAPGGAQAAAKPGRVSAGDVFNDAVNLLAAYHSVYSDDSWEEYLKYLAVARARELEFLWWRGFREIPPLNSTGLSGNDKYDRPPAVLTAVYGEDGHSHVWGVYVWEPDSKKSEANPRGQKNTGRGKSGKNARTTKRDEADGNYEGDRAEAGTALEFSRRELSAAVKTAREDGVPSPLEGRDFSGWKCSICGVRWGRTDVLDLKKAEASLKAKVDFDSFYTFFNSRCPEGGLHVFSGDDQGKEVKCSKCGVPSALLISTGRSEAPQKALKYYQKYRSVFEGESRLKSAALRLEEEDAAAAPTPKRPAVKEATPPARTFSALALAELLVGQGSPLTAGEIESFGTTEGREPAQVQAGEAVPPPPEELDDPRLQSADGNYRLLLTRYCRLTFGTLTPAQLKEASRGLSPAEVEAARKTLPPPSAYESEKRYFVPLAQHRAWARTLPADEQKQWAEALYWFTVDAFCSLALEIAKKGAALGTSFVLATVTEVVRGEMRFATPGEFKWEVFGDAEDSRGMSADDATTANIQNYAPPSTALEDELFREAAGGEDFSPDVDAETAETNEDADSGIEV